MVGEVCHKIEADWTAEPLHEGSCLAESLRPALTWWKDKINFYCVKKWKMLNVVLFVAAA